MKEIILIVDEEINQGQDVCFFYVFDSGVTYTYWMDEEWRIYTAIYACKNDVNVKEPIWQYILDPRDYSKYSDYTPELIMQIIQDPYIFSGLDIPAKIVRTILLDHITSDREFIRTSEIEHSLNRQLFNMVKEACEEYEQELEKDAKSNK